MVNFNPALRYPALVAFGLLAQPFTSPVAAQVTMDPARIAPASMERFALRIATGSEATQRVNMLLPDAITVLGVEKSPDWTYVYTPGSETQAAQIEWSGGPLEVGEYREFVFFGRLAADAKRKELIFPVTLTRVDGDQIEYNRNGGVAPPPVVFIVGSTSVTPWGAVGVAGLALALAIISLGLSASRNRSGAAAS